MAWSSTRCSAKLISQPSPSRPARFIAGSLTAPIQIGGTWPAKGGGVIITSSIRKWLPWYENGWLQSLRNRWDIVNRWWGQGVIGFDALRQRGLLTRFGIRYADTATLGVLLATSCVLFIAIGLAWALLRRRVRDPLRAALRELEHKLARRGIVRRHSEGPQHYLSRAARALPGQRGELALLMKCYLELRYAHDEPPPESLRDFQHAVRDFRVVRVVK